MAAMALAIRYGNSDVGMSLIHAAGGRAAFLAAAEPYLSRPAKYLGSALSRPEPVPAGDAAQIQALCPDLPATLEASEANSIQGGAADLKKLAKAGLVVIHQVG